MTVSMLPYATDYEHTQDNRDARRDLPPGSDLTVEECRLVQVRLKAERAARQQAKEAAS